MVNTESTMNREDNSNNQYVLQYKLKQYTDSEQNYWDSTVVYMDINIIKNRYNYQEHKLIENINYKNPDLTEEEKFNLEFDFNYNKYQPRLIGWLNHWSMKEYYVIFT